VQYYLPPFKYVTKDFLRDVLQNKKKLLTMGEIKPINIPNYDELSVKNLFKEVSEDPMLKDYFPDVKEK
jgi:hypothetical protein